MTKRITVTFESYDGNVDFVQQHTDSILRQVGGFNLTYGFTRVDVRPYNTQGERARALLQSLTEALEDIDREWQELDHVFNAAYPFEEDFEEVIERVRLWLRAVRGT